VTTLQRDHGPFGRIHVALVTSPLGALSALMAAPFTNLLNIITWNKAYSLVAKKTMIQHETCFLGIPDPSIQPALAAFYHSAWEIADLDIRDCGRPMDEAPPGLRIVRRIGDKDTWTLRLETTDVTPSHTPDIVVECSEFATTAEWDSRTISAYYEMHIRPLTHPLLRYEYTFVSQEHDKSPMDSVIMDALDRYLLWEVVKIEREGRPGGVVDERNGRFSCLLDRSADYKPPKDWAPPPSWRYVDDRLIGWWEEHKTRLYSKDVV